MQTTGRLISAVVHTSLIFLLPQLCFGLVFWGFLGTRAAAEGLTLVVYGPDSGQTIICYKQTSFGYVLPHVTNGHLRRRRV